jgi:xanthine permease XanP
MSLLTETAAAALLRLRLEPRVKVPCRVKPANLIYSVDEVPPLSLTLALGLQHVFVMSVGWIFVVVIAASIGASTPETQAMIRISMIASGLATILQAQTRGPMGSGYLCPLSCGASYVSASILAGQAGGLPLLWGMTAFSGMFESLLSRFMKSLRKLFPPEVTGLVVAMVGIGLVRIGAPRFAGYHTAQKLTDSRALAIALLTLAAMLAPTLWSKGKLRLYPVLIGLFTGYSASILTGVLNVNQLRPVLDAPFLSFPHRPVAGLSFSWLMVLPFLIASVCSVLKGVGDLTLCEKINDSNWKRTEMKDVSGGVFVSGLSSALSGLLGGVGQSTFSSSVGLSMATGATSRNIAWPVGLICIALAFFPRIAAIFSVMPEPVMGAVMAYVACFMMLGGLQVMLSRMLDSRRIFAIGIAFFFGLSVDTVPGIYAAAPAWIRPLFSSSLAFGTVLVVALNVLFQLGTSKRKTFEIHPAAGPAETDTRQAMETLGAQWGMRPDVAAQAAGCLHELVLYFAHMGVRSPVCVQARFSEFSLEFDIDYVGPKISFPDCPPSPEAIASDAAAMPLLCAYIIRTYADSVRVSSLPHRSRVHLHFDH